MNERAGLSDRIRKMLRARFDLQVRPDDDDMASKEAKRRYEEAFDTVLNEGLQSLSESSADEIRALLQLKISPAEEMKETAEAQPCQVLRKASDLFRRRRPTWYRVERSLLQRLTRFHGDFEGALHVLARYVREPWRDAVSLRQPVSDEKLNEFLQDPRDKLAADLAAEEVGCVLSLIASQLRPLGRLKESRQLLPFAMAVESDLRSWQLGHWAEVSKILGQLRDAVEPRLVALINDTEEPCARVRNLTLIADLCNQLGESEAAGSRFAEALDIVRQCRSELPYLQSVSGYRFWDYLLERGDAAEEVITQASASLERWKQGKPLKPELELNLGLLEEPLIRLARGRAYLQRWLRTKKPSEHESAEQDLHLAVEGFRKSNRRDYQPLGLLARAAFYRKGGRFTEAAQDLAAARKADALNQMTLHKVDCQLEWIRLQLDQHGGSSQDRDKESLKRSMAEVRAWLTETGYRLRHHDLKDLESAV